MNKEMAGKLWLKLFWAYYISIFFFAIKIFQKFRMTNKIISLQFNVIFHTIKKI